jgi:signal transduction histidine kinase
VVEDIPITREFLNRLLLDGGYRVGLCATATEALAEITEGLPDLVMLDLLLPDFNGLEVCRFLRTRPGGEDIPVLVITVDDRPSSQAEAVNAGADDFLRKPLSPVELQMRVRSLLRLRQLRGDLRRGREALLTLQAQKDELVQFVVHDLKNMLTSLLCSVDMAVEASAPGPAQHLERVQDTAQAMHGMVQDMLDLSVHEQAGLVPQMEEIILEPWLSRMLREVESLVRSRDQTLTLRVEPGLTLKADPQLLRRLMANLLENANKFGPPESEIGITAFRAGPNLRIQVADLGPGIPEDKKKVIFNRFVRLETGGEAPSGRGLGLAFCRLVMQLHGGSIWVEDHEPQGSRFLVEFKV